MHSKRRPAATLFFFDVCSSGPNVCAAAFVRQNLDGEPLLNVPFNDCRVRRGVCVFSVDGLLWGSDEVG